MRSTRIVCISDTHSTFPTLPPGDVLIHAGDITKSGTFPELQKAIRWVEGARFEAKIIIAGHQDVILDETYGHITSEVRRLMNSPKFTYLNHGAATIRLTNPTGPRTKFKVFGSPYSPGFGAFGYQKKGNVTLWDSIPLDSDIVVTHTPPKYHVDESRQRGSAGCEALRQALWRVRPQLAVCGHVHEARGAEIVRWDLGAPNIRYKEESVTYLQPRGRQVRSAYQRGDLGLLFPDERFPTIPGPSQWDNEAEVPATRGQGIPASGLPSGRCDVDALVGRLERRETCIVNAATLGSVWPHKAGKKFNEPIVVNLDLPVWKRDA